MYLGNGRWIKMNKQIERLMKLYSDKLEYAKVNYPNQSHYHEDLISDKRAKEFKDIIENIEYDKINWDKIDVMLNGFEDLFSNANNHQNGDLHYEVLYLICVDIRGELNRCRFDYDWRSDDY